ncbi:MAG: MASE3 domain-containing protein, partial [Gammaproteobacteria bacterium]
MFAETFSIVISMMVFGIAWNSYSTERPGNIVILACALLAVGLIDFAHMLSFKGMPDFVTPSDPEKAINLWLAARLVAALALLVVAIRPWRLPFTPRMRFGLLATSLVVSGVVIWLGLAYPKAWPHTFIEGEGLTSLKIGAEYTIIAILLVPAVGFYLQARRPQSYDAASLFAATVTTILSDLSFTLYSDVADIFNLLGHLYKILAYIFIYRAVFVSSVREPFQQLDAELAENKRITRQLQDSASERTQFAAIVKFSNDAIIGKTPDGIITSWNEGAERIYGYSADEIIGKHITALAPTDQHAEMRQLLEKVCDGEIVISHEAERVRKDGTHFYVSLTLSPIRDASGKISGISTIARDITESKRIQQDIIAREIDFRTLVENSTDPILRYDRDCRRVYVNPEIHRISGKPIESLIGHTPGDGQLLGDNEAEKLTAAIRRTFDSNQACHTEFEFIDLNGDLHGYDMLLIPEHDADGQVKTVLGIARDITERRLAELELHRLNRELQAISNCNQSLLKASDEQELLNEICGIICKQAGYLLAWVGYAENDKAKTIEPVAWAGEGGDYIADAKLSWAEDAEHGFSPVAMVIRSGESIYVEDLEEIAPMAPWRQIALEHGYRSVIALPLKNESGQPFGALSIYSSEKNSINQAEISLLEELAADMAYGITNLRARAESMRASEALADSEHMQRLLLDSLTQQVFYKDLDSRYIACNRTYAHRLGMEPNDLVGKSDFELYPQELAERYRVDDRAVMASGEVMDIEEPYEAGGQRFWIHTVKTPIRDPSGNVTGILGIFWDITEQKYAAQELERSRAGLS